MDNIYKAMMYKYDRNTEVEKYAVDEFLKRTSSCLTKTEIEDVLRKNHYNGIYLLSSEDLRKITSSNYVDGLYNENAGAIFLDGSKFNFKKDIVVHELVHAYLNSHNIKKMMIDSECGGYGVGLEEGFASIVESTHSVDNIDDCKLDSYIYEGHLFKQINMLYKLSENKKYPNLCHHILKEPNDFLPVIADVYLNILTNATDDCDDVNLIALRSAFALVNATDIMIDVDDADDKSLYRTMNSINTVYLSLADRKARDGVEAYPIFPALSQVVKSKEEKLLSAIFDFEDDYMNRQIELLNGLLVGATGQLESPEYKKNSEAYELVKSIKNK